MSGNFFDELKKFFVVDTSDPKNGIKISLPAKKQPEPELDLAKPIYGIQIVNGRIVRESRHGASEYANWVSAAGPADTELEKKKHTSRIRDNGPPIKLNDLEYVVVDTETTGGSMMYGHRITEIAIVRVNASGNILHEYTTLVNPGRSIPAAITAITHIDSRMVRSAPRFEDIAEDVRSLLDGRIFVAHNATFDWSFVSGELVRTTGQPLFGRKLCTVRLARKVVPEVRRRSLDHLSYYFNVPNEARHRAFGDARATAVLFRRMMDRVFDRQIDTWQELEKLTLRRSQRTRRTAMPTPMQIPFEDF